MLRDPSKPQPLRDEACGFANACDEILDVEKLIVDLDRLMREE